LLRIRQLLTPLKEKIKLRLKIPNEPKQSFREVVASSLDRILFLHLFLYFVFFFISLIPLFPEFQGSISTMTKFFGIYSGVSVLIALVFFGFYVEPKIISKIDSLSSLAKYGVLNARSLYPKFGWTCIIIAIVSSFSWSIAYASKIVPVSFFQSTQILFGFFTNFLLAFGFLNFMFITFMNANKEVELSFSVITDYESIANENNKVLYQNRQVVLPSAVWSLCMKQIVQKLEDLLKRRIGFSGDIGSEFYKPFNTVSFAALAGSPEQQEKAKAWVTDLGHIVTEKGVSVTAKNKSLIEHLEKVKTEQTFKNLENMQERFGFHYDFEHGGRRLRRTWKRILGVVVGLGSIIGFIQLIRAIFNI
jgi:hypothetical protein